MVLREKWVRGIQWCISIASFSKLNGTPHGFFRNSMGLRQGDPLSPYLFVITMEAISRLVETAVEGGYLTSYSVEGRGGEGIKVSHLLFADDTLVFCEASQDHFTYLCWLFEPLLVFLMWFEVISGLKIILEKSEIIPIGSIPNVEVLDEGFWLQGGQSFFYLPWFAFGSLL